MPSADLWVGERVARRRCVRQRPGPKYQPGTGNEGRLCHAVQCRRRNDIGGQRGHAPDCPRYRQMTPSTNGVMRGPCYTLTRPCNGSASMGYAAWGGPT